MATPLKGPVPTEIGRIDQRVPYDEAEESAAANSQSGSAAPAGESEPAAQAESPTKRSGLAIGLPGASSGPNTKDDKAWIKANAPAEYASEKPEPLLPAEVKKKDPSSWIQQQQQQQSGQEQEQESPRAVGKLDKRAVS